MWHLIKWICGMLPPPSTADKGSLKSFPGRLKWRCHRAHQIMAANGQYDTSRLRISRVTIPLPPPSPLNLSSILRDWIPWFSSLPEAMGLGGWFKFPFVRSWTAKRGLCWNSFFHQNFSSQEIFSLRNCPSVLNLCLKSRGKPEGKRSQLSIWNMCFNIAPAYFSASNTVYFSTSPLDTIYLAA